MKNLFVGTFAAFSVATCAAATPAATVLFAQEGTQIVDTNGVARSAKKGDVVQNGERLLTTTGSISQIQLPDGSLIGMRPGSEIRLSADTTAPQSAPVLTLMQGAARVIGSELMDAKKTSHITLQSGFATLRLQGADLESAVVKADKGASPSNTTASTPGSYQRLLVGSGSIGSGAQLTSLAPRQVNFIGSSNTPPTVIATAMPALAMGNRTAAPNLGEADLAGKTIQPTLTNRVSPPVPQPPSFTDRAPSAPIIPNLGNMPLAPATTLQSPPMGNPIVNAPPLAPLQPMAPVTLTPPTPSAPLPTAPTLTLVLPSLPTAPIPAPVTPPTTPIVINTPTLVSLTPVIQPIVNSPLPITTQPIVTKPPVCTRLIAGRCV